MNISVETWPAAIQLRHSRRQFLSTQLTAESHLRAYAAELSASMPGVRVEFITENPEKVFKGIVGSYGKVKGAPAYAAFIGDLTDANVQEKLGYVGEAFILEATALGLGTCWIGGFFNPEIAASQTATTPNEQVLAVTPVGHINREYSLAEKIMSGFSTLHKRKDLASLCSGMDPSQYPEWVKTALEAARLAPSAVNRQPWRFVVDEYSIKVTEDQKTLPYNISKRLDCGIAMLHLETGALDAGIKGSWEYLESPDVAVFKTIA